jgi:hypothetical protein
MNSPISFGTDWARSSAGLLRVVEEDTSEGADRLTGAAVWDWAYEVVVG